MRRFLRAALGSHGLQVVEAATAREGLAQAAGRNPDVILLDLGLPDRDGHEVMRELRRLTRAPIIVISARGQEHEKVQLLDLGADDYLTKPFGSAELLARIRVALRHAAQPLDHLEDPILLAGGVRVDALRRQVFRDDDEVHLTPTEYKLLATLVRQAGRVLTPSAAARAGLGRQLHPTDALSPGLHGAIAPQAGARSHPSPRADHRARGRLPAASAGRHLSRRAAPESAGPAGARAPAHRWTASPAVRRQIPQHRDWSAATARAGSLPSDRTHARHTEWLMAGADQWAFQSCDRLATICSARYCFVALPLGGLTRVATFSRPPAPSSSARPPSGSPACPSGSRGVFPRCDARSRAGPRFPCWFRRR